MKDGITAGEQVEVSRQDLYEDYEKCYLQECTEVGPCRDVYLLKKAAQYLLREPEPRETSTILPVYQALREGCAALSTDCRKLLSAFMKAVELLETVCVNLFLQPWKKEIKTLKTFTGPFVYCLLPVLSGSTIQSVLASIGYLPDTDTPHREYRLSEDANPDGAALVGFELLLVRVQCYNLLELLDKDQLGPQDFLEVLQRRLGPLKEEEPSEKKITKMQKEEKKKEDADIKEVPPHLEQRLAVNPKPKPRHCHLNVDQSIMEMQMTYPDLAFRGRPLLPDKPLRANSSRRSSKAAQTEGTTEHSDDSRAAEMRDCVKDTAVAAAATVLSKADGRRAAEGDEGRISGCTDRTSGDIPSSSLSDTDGSRVDELSPSQSVSLRITLRAGSTAEQRLKPAEPQPTAEPSTCTQQLTAADPQNKRPVRPPSLSSMDEEQELRGLAERMGQLHVHEANEELKRKEVTKRGEEKASKERRRKKERKVSKEREEEQRLRRPVMEAGPGPSHSRDSRSCQSDPAMKKDPSPVSTADCQRRHGGEEEQLAQGYVIVEPHNQ